MLQATFRPSIAEVCSIKEQAKTPSNDLLAGIRPSREEVQNGIPKSVDSRSSAFWSVTPASRRAAVCTAGILPGSEYTMITDHMEIQSIQSFLDYYEKIRQRTLRVVRCVPPDKIEWSPLAGTFTIGDLIRHIAAIERFMYAENVNAKTSRYSGHGKELADGYDEVLKFLDSTHKESMEIFAKLTDKDLQKKCITPEGTPITVWKWLRAMIEHEVHHRGQIYLYLAQLDVPTPPLFGLTSEEVRSRSIG